MRVAPGIILTNQERAELMKLVRSRLTSLRLEPHSGIVLLTGIDRDLPHGAPPGAVDVARLVELATQSKPEAGTHLSTRTTPAQVGVSAADVSRHWRANGLKPHLVRGVKVLRDSKVVDKLNDIVGIYMSPGEHALVLCCDEKNQVQALDRTQPEPPIRRGRACTVTHDYKRNGTISLFAVLNVLDGQVISECQKRHRGTEWLKFLRQIDRQTPTDKALLLIADNYATHKHPEVQERLSKHPRVTMRLTPTSASWLNMVERFFRDIDERRLRRGVFTSVQEIVTTIDEYVAHHNTNLKPCIWIKSARDILQKVVRANNRLGSRQNAAQHAFSPYLKQQLDVWGPQGQGCGYSTRVAESANADFSVSGNVFHPVTELAVSIGHRRCWSRSPPARHAHKTLRR